jgi:hypothetical protein
MMHTDSNSWMPDAMAKYVEPQVTVREVTARGDATCVTLEFSRAPDSPPIAPGALYRPPDLSHWVFEVHQLSARMGSILTLETYNTLLAPPQIGEQYTFRSWWTKQAAEAVLDRSARWVERVYPGKDEHDHCLLTWDAIYSGQVGRFSDAHGWITSDAYRQFIENDPYRVRANNRAWNEL